MSSNTQNFENNILVQTHPKATYKQVVEDESVFMGTLQDLLKSVGTKFTAPKIAGEPLDLHRLFVEVSSRGGLKKVIQDRRLKEVTSLFTFPPTTPGPSFFLRRHYIVFLLKYEHFYLFGGKQPELSLNDAKVGSVPEVPIPAVSNLHNRGVGYNISGQHLSRVGDKVRGKINAKFENGYAITAIVGSEAMHGVLYHIPMSHGDSQKRSRNETGNSELKPNDKGFSLFFSELYSKVMPLYSGQEEVIVRHINSLWDKLSKSEKEVYQDKVKEQH